MDSEAKIKRPAIIAGLFLNNCPFSWEGRLLQQPVV
jgi:hypothetical protein